MAQNKQKSVRLDEAPNAQLTMPVASSPPPSITRGDSTSDSVPEMNLLMP